MCVVDGGRFAVEVAAVVSSMKSAPPPSSCTAPVELKTENPLVPLVKSPWVTVT